MKKLSKGRIAIIGGVLVLAIVSVVLFVIPFYRPMSCAESNPTKEVTFAYQGLNNGWHSWVVYLDGVEYSKIESVEFSERAPYSMPFCSAIAAHYSCLTCD